MNKTVLLIEDDPDEVLLARRAFAGAGLADCLALAADGKAACRRLREEATPGWPILVLLDWQMADMDGLAVLRDIGELRSERAEAAALPVAVLSSSDDPGDIAAAYGAGANSYLRKPVDFDEFVRMVGDVYRYWAGHNVLPSAQGRA
jgi:CheY-like chemotaxis protein